MGEGDRPVRRGLPRAAPPSAGPTPTSAPRPAATPPVAATRRTESPSTAERLRAVTPVQWAGVLSLGGFAAMLAVGVAVVVAQWTLVLPPVEDFVARFPGEYELPAGAPVGLPAWLGWQHFFNAFLLVLIIQSGLRVRGQRRPDAYWTSRRTGTKVSIHAWLHQSLDVLWLLNGIAYVVLLFATGQWVRIVPTSWEVFPNAVSAALQYVSLDWPTENGWVNYNSLQQLAYFTTVFVAAPAAAVTGFRMSALWPPRPTALGRMFPMTLARAVHFPVMLFFVAFVVTHVALVLATGALRNLNHMYGGQDAINWTGFAIFVVSTLVIIAAAVAARPVIISPVARLFGTVSAR